MDQIVLVFAVEKEGDGAPQKACCGHPYTIELHERYMLLFLLCHFTVSLMPHCGSDMLKVSGQLEVNHVDVGVN